MSCPHALSLPLHVQSRATAQQAVPLLTLLLLLPAVGVVLRAGPPALHHLGRPLRHRPAATLPCPHFQGDNRDHPAGNRCLPHPAQCDCVCLFSKPEVPIQTKPRLCVMLRAWPSEKRPAACVCHTSVVVRWVFKVLFVCCCCCVWRLQVRDHGIRVKEGAEYSKVEPVKEGEKVCRAQACAAP